MALSNDLKSNLKNARLRLGLSQELAAERLGVSRQALTKWEAGQSRPSARNLAALAELYQVSPEELLGSGEDGKPNLILRANLIKLSIITQGALLNICAYDLYMLRTGRDVPLYRGALLFFLVPLLASSIWMTSHHRFEPDPVRRRKNTRIELVYCLIMLAAGLSKVYAGTGLVGTAAMIVIMSVYILYVNPKFMGRKLTK